jgi:hypothetical protein
MPFVINDVTYAGEAASGFIVKSLTGSDTINKGLVYVKDGIKKKFTIPRMVVADLIQDPAPTPTSQGTATVDAQVLDPEEWLIYMEFNPRDFEDHWAALQLSPDLLDRTLPTTAESVLVQEVLKIHANHIESILWRGDVDLSNSLKYFDGFVRKMVESAATKKVASPAVLDTSNIFTKMEAGYALIPDALKYDTDVKYMVNYKTADVFRKAQQNQTYKGVDVTSGGIYSFNGKGVEICAGLPDDTFVVAKGRPDPTSNLWVGMNSIGDETKIQLARLQANSELFFIKLMMKADVNFGFGEEVVIHTTVAARD